MALFLVRLIPALVTVKVKVTAQTNAFSSNILALISAGGSAGAGCGAKAKVKVKV